MPRNCARKTTRQSWPIKSMELALQAVESGQMGYLKASKEFGLPKTTLKRRHKGINKKATGSSKVLGRYDVSALLKGILP